VDSLECSELKIANLWVQWYCTLDPHLRKYRHIALDPIKTVYHCAFHVASGFNVAVGGGLGFTHNNQKTHPRLADVIGSLAALCQSVYVHWFLSAMCTKGFPRGMPVSRLLQAWRCAAQLPPKLKQPKPFPAIGIPFCRIYKCPVPVRIQRFSLLDIPQGEDKKTQELAAFFLV